MPFINQAILMSGKWLQKIAHDLPSWHSEVLDTDMAFAAWMREKVPILVPTASHNVFPSTQGHFMHVSNLHDYGHLLYADSYDTTRLHGDMYQLFDNNLVG